MKIKQCFIIIFMLICTFSVKSQTFNKHISYNNTFYTDTIVRNVFDNSTTYGVAFTGQIRFTSEMGFARIIVNNSNNEKHLVHESYSMFEQDSIINLSQVAEESRYLNAYRPTELIIQLHDANITINTVDCNSNLVANVSTLHQQNILDINNQKLTKVQDFITDKGLIWKADHTSVSDLTYSQKAKLWGNDYISYGFEFYAGGIYSISIPDRNETNNYGYAARFDWREQHNANNSNSPYYDGDTAGSGWITPVVCQGQGCWNNGVFTCDVTLEDCIEEGGEFRDASTCWIFAPTAQLEAITNLYYNEHLDIDLSELYIACEEGTIDSNITEIPFDYFANGGVPDEAYMPYIATLDSCNSIYSEPQEIIRITSHDKILKKHGNIDSTKQNLIKYGPLTASNVPYNWGRVTHAMLLVGWDVIDEDTPEVKGLPTDDINHTWYGVTYWIYKNSIGYTHGHNGYTYILSTDSLPTIYWINTPIYSINRDDTDIKCYDKDGDGYYNWGIGTKPIHCPLCFDEPDGNDNHPGLGPVNTNGQYTIIGPFNANFETGWDNWRHVNYDTGGDWWRHKGASIFDLHQAQRDSFYIYINPRINNGQDNQKTYAIESAPIDFSNFCNGVIDFYYYQQSELWGNPDSIKLELQISYDNGNNWIPDYWFVSDNQGASWKHASVTFPSDVNKIKFIARSGRSHDGVIALDNITIAPLNINEEDLVIDNTVVWENPQIFNRNIIVDSCGILTIKDSIYMDFDAGIIVKPGGRLILDGATLTSICDNQMWQGIQVWGNSSADQQVHNGVYYQGYLEIKNGSMIENAITAVDLWKPGDYNKTGGIIIASNAVFRNNTKSIHVLNYPKIDPTSTVMRNYTARFSDCVFEITSDYNGGAIFSKHIDLANVKGIRFLGCDFSLDNVNDRIISEYNYAIYSYNAGFSVESLCDDVVLPCPETSIDKSTFSGFYNAINSMNDGSNPMTFTVSNSVFTGNAYGIRSRHNNNAIVKYSDFMIGSQGDCGIGILSESTTGFTFEENDFSKTSMLGGKDYFGIVIKDSRNTNEIYKNTFSNLTCANYSNGKNWVDDYTYKGLTYGCNENSNNVIDFYVADYSTGNRSGIQSLQGSTTSPAGNTFSQGNNTTWNIYNGGEFSIQYYYNQNDLSEIPNANKTSRTIITPINKTNNCASHNGTVTMSPDEILQIEQEYYEAYANYNNVKALYNSYVDGGSTSDEISDIRSAQPSDAWTLREQLLGHSPHLSQAVLMEVADRPDVFSNSVMFEILAANPEELRQDTLMNYLVQKEEPMPQYMLDILSQTSSESTYKTVLQQQMAIEKSKYSAAANAIIKNMLNDTVMDYTQLRNWLDNLGGISADRQIISTYIAQNNYTDALSLANLLPQLYNLQGEELTEHNQYVDMIELYRDLQQDGRNTFQMNDTEKSFVEDMAGNGTGIAKAMATSVIEGGVGSIDDINCPTIVVSGGSGGGAKRTPSNEDISKAYGLSVSVNPNPANTWVAVDYTLPASKNQAVITLTDSEGNIVKTLSVTDNQGQVTIDTRNLPSGLYLYTIKCDEFIQSGKLIIKQ